VTSLYLLTANGQTAQKNTANSARLTGATTVANGSDNALLSFFLDPALGCTPMTALTSRTPGRWAPLRRWMSSGGGGPGRPDRPHTG